jgi:2'-hydroxyisoflavone reductase
MPVQFIDIRDLAEWAIRMIEKGATGTYNAVGPEKPLTFGEVLNAAGTVTSTSPKLTWVPASFINGQQDASLRRVTFWTAEDYGNRCRLSNARAVASGFKTRPVKTTVQDTINWYDDLPADQQSTLLEFWKQKEDGSGYESVVPPWSTYLQREKAARLQSRTRCAASTKFD